LIFDSFEQHHNEPQQQQQSPLDEEDLLDEWETYEENNKKKVQPYRHHGNEIDYGEEKEEMDEGKHHSTGIPIHSSNSPKHFSEADSKFKMFYSFMMAIHHVLSHGL
jgi:hypothetical protein